MRKFILYLLVISSAFMVFIHFDILATEVYAQTEVQCGEIIEGEFGD